MTDTDVVIPPHSLWLTSIEEDNRNIDFVLKNHDDESVNFDVKIETPSNIITRCINTDEEFNTPINELNFTVNPEKQKVVTLSFRYVGTDHREDTLKIYVSEGSNKTNREFDIVLFEN